MTGHEFDLIKGWCEANSAAIKELEKVVREHDLALARREGSKATWAAIGGGAVVVIDILVKIIFKS